TCGLLRPTFHEVLLAPPEKRAELLALAGPDHRSQVVPCPGYSEYVGWYVLGRAIAYATGMPPEAFLHTAVLEPLQLHGIAFGMTPERFAEERWRIGIYFANLPDAPTPFLSDRTA